MVKWFHLRFNSSFSVRGLAMMAISFSFASMSGSNCGISRALLTDRLQRLVKAGVLERTPYESNRVRYEYRLTGVGLELYPILQALRAWGDKHLAPDGAPLLYRHRGCRGHAAVALECSECHQPLSARDVDVHPGPGLLPTRGKGSRPPLAAAQPAVRRKGKTGRSHVVGLVRGL